MQVVYIHMPFHPVTIVVVGAGGNGSQVITQLGRVNYALRKLGKPGLHVILMDDDIVSESNIGRQLFTESEIGEYKANVLIGRVNRAYGTEWQSVCRAFNKTNAIKANVYITCTDNVKSRLAVHDFVNKRRDLQDHARCFFYWMDLGNTKTTGQVIVSSKHQKLPSVVDRFPNMADMADDDDTPSCSLAEALGRQDLFINTFLANVAAKLLWEMLTQPEVNWCGAFINLDTLNFKKIAA